MSLLHRRQALFGLLAAPFIVKTPGLLMPIKPVQDLEYITVNSHGIFDITFIENVDYSVY